MKRIVLFIVTCLIILTTYIFKGENPYPYRGEYKELYTTAIYSIPDAVGYMHHGEGAISSDIYVWEQDSYGRTLFSYCEDYNRQIFGLVISQGYDETNVYFYPEKNYVLTLIDSEHSYGGTLDDFLKNKTEEFYLANKEKFKEENDWNKPLDKTKCVSYPITDHKIVDKNTFSFKSNQCDEILNEYTKKLKLRNPNKTPHRYNNILQVDSEGKILHEIYGVHQRFDYPNPVNPEGYTYYTIILWVITDKEGNYDKENGVMVMYSKPNNPDKSYIYDSEDILEFKNKNGWNYSFCD